MTQVQGTHKPVTQRDGCSRYIMMIPHLRCATCLAVACLLLTCPASGETYTAVKSGYWRADSTWGGVAPPSTISTDSIIIPAGIDVRMDDYLNLDGPLASLTVEGRLLPYSPAYSYRTLTVARGMLAGNGTITAYQISIETAAKFDFTGVVVVEYFKSSAANLQLRASLRVLRQLEVAAGVFTVASGGKLEMVGFATLKLGNGDFAVDGGLFVTTSYRVHYSYGKVRRLGGLELSGVGLSQVTISTTFILDKDWTLNGIAIDYGVLDLNGHDLTVNYFTGGSSGGIVSTFNSSVTIKRRTTGSVRFKDDGHVRSLTFGTNSSDSVQITGNVTVQNLLDVQGTLLLRYCTLAVEGSIRGQYHISGDRYSTLAMNTSGSVVTKLAFAPKGEMLKNLTVKVGTGHTLQLTTPLAVSGVVTVESGSFDVRGVNLTLSNTMIGPGRLIADTSTTLTFTGEEMLMTPAIFPASTIGTLKLDLGDSGRVLLGNDLTVAKALVLKMGVFDLNAKDLTLKGDILSDKGAIHSTAESNITFAGRQTTDIDDGGVIKFTADGNTVGVLTVETFAPIHNNLRIERELFLNGGELYFPNYSLLVLNGKVHGSGSIFGWDVAVHANAEGEVNGGEQKWHLRTLVVNAGESHHLSLSPGLTIIDTLLLRSGVLDVSDGNLDVRSILQIEAGALATNAKTDIELVLDEGLTSPLTMVTDTVGNFTIRVDSLSSLTLDHDLTVVGWLQCSRTSLILNGHDLTVLDRISLPEPSRIVSTSASNITINSQRRSPGEISFDSSSNTVNNLIINVPDAQAVNLWSNAHVVGKLILQGGRLYISDNTLTLSEPAIVEAENDSAYISTAYHGCVAMYLDASNSEPVLYPVGTGYGYFPATVTLLPGSSSGMVRVGARYGVPAKGIISALFSGGESALNIACAISTDISTNLQFDLELGWRLNSERPSFDRDHAYISHFTNGKWDVVPAAAAINTHNSLYTIVRTNLMTGGEFAVFGAVPTDVDYESALENAFVSADLNIYPSPATDFIILDNVASDGLPINVDIIDAQGRIVMSFIVCGTNHKVSILGLGSGVYFVRMHDGRSTTTKQFVKI